MDLYRYTLANRGVRLWPHVFGGQTTLAEERYQERITTTTGSIQAFMSPRIACDDLCSP